MGMSSGPDGGFAKYVQSMCWELGSPTFRSVSDRLPPMARTLLGKTRVLFSNDPGPWLNLHVTYELAPCEVMSNEFVTREMTYKKAIDNLIQMIESRRKFALCQLADDLLEAFKGQAGTNANPEEWRVVLLRDGYLLETACQSPSQDVTVFIELTYRFERVPQEVPA